MVNMCQMDVLRRYPIDSALPHSLASHSPDLRKPSGDRTRRSRLYAGMGGILKINNDFWSDFPHLTFH